MERRRRPEDVERALKLQEGSVLAREVLALRIIADTACTQVANVAELPSGFDKIAAATLEDTQGVDIDATNAAEIKGYAAGLRQAARAIRHVLSAGAGGAEAAIERVRKLHGVKVTTPGDDGSAQCLHCAGDWPCATRRALDGVA